MTTQPDWQRLAQAIRARMTDLRLTYRSIDSAGGPSTATMRKLLKANPKGEDVAAITRERLEGVLQWEEGAVDAVLAGGNPTPLVKGLHMEAEPVGGSAHLLMEVMNGASRLPEKDLRELLALIEAKGK